jgi:uncharacterized membrane protein
MGWHYFGALVAGGGAILHIVFAYNETLGWNRKFVDTVAHSWIEGLDEDLSNRHIFWAKRLAFNIGAYNLMLAVGLAWNCWAFIQQPALAGMLGTFFAIWLLAAAAAALHTQVYLAAKLQGGLGVFLGMAVFEIGDAPAPRQALLAFLQRVL